MTTHDTNGYAPASSASARLRQSRQAMLVQMGRSSGTHDAPEPANADRAAHPASGQASGNRGWWGLLKRAVRSWWQRHPVRAVTDIATPVLGLYVREQPLKVLGIAAAVGAAVVVLRPWRLLSAGALLAAAVRPSDISGLVLSLMAEPSGRSSEQRGNDAGPLG